MAAQNNEKPQYIFRSSITLPNGQKIYASQYGRKAFRIPVKSDDKGNGKTK